MSEEEIEFLLKDHATELVKLTANFEKVVGSLEDISVALLRTIRRVKNLEKNL